MRQLKVILAVLVLAIAACRSVPSNVRAAHDLSLTESKAAFVIAEDTLAKIETKSAELNDATVSAAYVLWLEHRNKVVSARGVVARYLADSKAGKDVTEPYATGRQLLADMNRGFAVINARWVDILKTENDADRVEFVALFRKDIDRFRVLERKFDEYIKQFKVKG